MKPQTRRDASQRAAAIERNIVTLRGQRVMLDASLAALYQVTTGNLNLAVRRNRGRFPPDFMFELTPSEADSLLLQSARAKKIRGGRRTPPSAFTELGVAMLSSLLKSERAVRMNIEVMRTFVRMRELLARDHGLGADMRERVARLEARQSSFQRECRSGLETLAAEIAGMGQPRARRIGFSAGAG